MTIIFISALLTLTTPLSMPTAQTKEVPLKVQSEFKKMYAKANSVEWELTKEGYIVNFLLREISKESTFETSGKWIETKSYLTVEGLSTESKKAIAKMFPESSLEDMTLIEKLNAKTYEVGVITQTDSYVVVVLNEKGKIIESY